MVPGSLPRRQSSQNLRPRIRLRRRGESPGPRPIRGAPRDPPQPDRNRQISGHQHALAGEIQALRHVGHPVQYPRDPGPFLCRILGDPLVGHGDNPVLVLRVQEFLIRLLL
ncbi:very-long-chain (3r)-3-hydroxyacyl-coa dehydratase pasticcino 2 [Phtheirospermum japonicum]|uniref:Very-long-chain (3r)-3-hydroxyacyl-coa dehydratase pasticcino 2 n=1 Tax=Phtheirospermum japonicum TaxID=374723 RepID=A0A830D4X5_9LAMI|nr:very-long-chain (3r)-3-hydroxyacyl-coa dehydratase pasticcino 2 [Phtheirospermum japonicum]